ncbi:hypothetical protein ACFFRL_00225 [Agromyces hippuratus]|uniref:hypothetical protein n=1 Tax=Agromyces hippuratus TaxID=286438 RepID=UPI0035EEEEB5
MCRGVTLRGEGRLSAIPAIRSLIAHTRNRGAPVTVTEQFATREAVRRAPATQATATDAAARPRPAGPGRSRSSPTRVSRCPCSAAGSCGT